MGEVIYKLFCYAVLFVILFVILLYIYGWIAKSERELAEEKCERKYRRKIKMLEDEAQRPVIGINVLDGEAFTVQKKRFPEEVVIENRTVERLEDIYDR